MDLRIRVAEVVDDVHLSWRKDVAPGIQRIEDGMT
jgi:hypothetical protein